VFAAAGAFLSFLLSAGGCFLSADGALAAGCSVFISGAVAAGAGFREDGAFFSGFVAAGSFAAGGWAAAAGSLTAGASVFGARAGASVFGATAGASAFGALGALGFTSAGAFLSGFLPDSSGVGCWAITAPASASEQTINKLVIFFMLSLCWS
jgi:hypothetical protein